MTAVYLATSGSYSDYTVHRVFLDKALAEQYLADGFCDEIDEREITEVRVLPGQLLTMQWTSAHDTATGHAPADDWTRFEHVEVDDQPQCEHHVHKREASYTRGEHTIVVVRGLDHERVRKVYSEQVAMTRVELGELDPAGAE